MLQTGCRGVARSTDGTIKEFHQRGVRDLIELIASTPDFLDGAQVADKVVGRGAALLMVKGRVSQVYAVVISQGALHVLREAGVKVDYGEMTSYIINRRGDGMCPIESLTSSITDADEAYEKIKNFIQS